MIGQLMGRLSGFDSAALIQRLTHRLSQRLQGPLTGTPRLLQGKDPVGERHGLVRRELRVCRHRHAAPYAAAAVGDLVGEVSGRVAARRVFQGDIVERGPHERPRHGVATRAVLLLRKRKTLRRDLFPEHRARRHEQARQRSGQCGYCMRLSFHYGLRRDDRPTVVVAL
ncbi:protein of unknown function [Paraburkholderia kururiensis]